MSLRKEDISITSSLTALGLNSLVSVEIRRWWRQNLGLEISVLQITSLDSVQQLGVLPIDSLREKHLGGEEQDPAAKKYMTPRWVSPFETDERPAPVAFQRPPRHSWDDKGQYLKVMVGL
ncbi:putative PKS/NRPS-like protein biosynthetic cluster [Aspergillus niger]|nr:putative PKS/NRPS-like protein biosynthetic cluster [Aspergillus niger]